MNNNTVKTVWNNAWNSAKNLEHNYIKYFHHTYHRFTNKTTSFPLIKYGHSRIFISIPTLMTYPLKHLIYDKFTRRIPTDIFYNLKEQILFHIYDQYLISPFQTDKLSNAFRLAVSSKTLPIIGNLLRN